MPRYIDADALRAGALKATKLSDFAFDNCYPYWKFAMCIKQAATADVVPVVRGEWVKKSSEEAETLALCSKCSYPISWWHKTNYCPNCGAKMEDTP